MGGVCGGRKGYICTRRREKEHGSIDGWMDGWILSGCWNLNTESFILSLVPTSLRVCVVSLCNINIEKIVFKK